MQELSISETDGKVCEFWVRPSSLGGGSQFRLHVRVDKIFPASDRAFISLALTEQDTGERLGLFAQIKATSTRGGCVDVADDCPHEGIRLKWCGIEPGTRDLLGAHGIHSLGDLKLYTEKGVCEKLLPPNLAPTPQTIDSAVRRYVAMRTHLKRMEFTQNHCGTETELATADQLRAALRA